MKSIQHLLGLAPYLSEIDYVKNESDLWLRQAAQVVVDGIPGWQGLGADLHRHEDILHILTNSD